MDSQLGSGESARSEMIAEWKNNWRAALASAIGMGLGGTITTMVFGLFILSLQKEFGWSRAELATVFATGFVQALLAPAAGRMIDRFGVRRPLLITLSVMVLSYVALAMMNGNLILFYIIMCILRWTCLPATGLSYAKVVSQHFDKARGVALAVSRSGLAITNTALPILLYFVIDRAGWRVAYLTVAALILLLNLSTVYLWVRDPAEPAASGRAAKAKAKAKLSWREIFGDQRLLLLCGIAFLGFSPAVSLQSQLLPMLVDRGQDGGFAATLVGLLGGASFLGALLTGALIDRFEAVRVGCVFALLTALGCSLLMIDAASSAVLVFAIILVGLGLGAELDLMAYMVSRIYGLASFGSVYGIITLVLAMATSAWSMLIGYSYAALHSYAPILSALVGACLITALLFPLLGRASQRAALA